MGDDISTRGSEKNGNGNKETFNLEGRKALITGSPDALGRAIALALGSSGAEVAINYSSQEDVPGRVSSYVDDIGGEVWVYPARMNDLAEVVEMRKRLAKRFGHIDILVNNAGIDFYRSFKAMNEGQLEKVISVNLDAALNSINVFLDDILLSEHGRIINITSTNGGMGYIGQLKYVAAKAGIIGLTQTLAKQLAMKHVTVNAISPGFLETEAASGMPAKLRKEILSNIPIGRLGVVEDIARAVAFLASDSAGYITGQVLNVNGGLHL
jgi:3-oxoacyl-[acyl-carrier protein] reductase